MPSCKTIYQRLRNCNQYLSSYHLSHQSARFEELVCQAFAALLRLPYYDADNDDSNTPYRVTWQGSASSSSKAPTGPDGIGRAHEFYFLVEATRKTTIGQWSQEFAQCLNHAQNVSQNNNIDPNDLYIILVTTKLHKDTYHSVKTYNAGGNFKFIPMEIDSLLIAVETSFLAFTIRQLETRSLLNGLLKCLSDSNSLRDYQDRAMRFLEDWQKKVLGLEKVVMLAIKSYEAMIKEASEHIGVSQILMRLKKNPIVKWYLGIIECDLGPRDISNSLLVESLGVIVGRLLSDEELFYPVPLIEFESRCQRRLKAVEDAHGRK